MQIDTPRAAALYLAAVNCRLEDRIAFAQGILPVVERYAGVLQSVLAVDQMLPRNLPAASWAALAADHLAFLHPEIETLAGRAEQDIAAAREGQ